MGRKKKNSNRRLAQSLGLNLLLIVISILIIWIIWIVSHHMFNQWLETVVQERLAQEAALQSELAKETEWIETEPPVETEAVPETEEYMPVPEVDIRYRFLQGPKAWENKRDWSGSWAKKELAGSTFGDFGCGMCCMANIYSTFSEFECSPMDMYYYAQEVSDYSPGGGYGAIAWKYMGKTLETCGFRLNYYNKDEYFKDFVNAIQNAWCAIVLVSAYNDNSYWETTEGHYVTIMDYNPEDHTVYLADSGNYEHNGQRIPLETVYSALKTANEYQYMCITGYQSENNKWQHDGANDEWVRP